MTSKNDGGPAFASPDWNGSWVGPDANHGMTLRDWFAGQAFAGQAGKFNSPKDAARSAYAYADAMLEERRRE